MGKGENAGNQQLFPKCFVPYQGHKSSFEQCINCRLQALSIWASRKMFLFGKELKRENIMRRGENAGDQHFFLVTQYFSKAFLPSHQNTGIVGRSQDGNKVYVYVLVSGYFHSFDLCFI